jgi:hypothetical protein
MARPIALSRAQCSGSFRLVEAHQPAVADNAHIWADRFDGPLEDIFELRDEVASSVVGGNCAADRLDHARGLDQNAVAGCLDDAPAMLADFGVDQFAPMRPQPREGTFLVGAHKPAVPRDVRGENGGQPAFEAFGGQSGAP